MFFVGSNLFERGAIYCYVGGYFRPLRANKFAPTKGLITELLT